MKLTPLDIHHKEFRHALRGYSEEEVDQFLDEVADEFERLFKENIDLNEKLEAATERLRGYSEMERTLHNTMLAAQQSAEDIVNRANKEAEMVLRDAELKAKELVHAALDEKQKTQGEFARIKAAEDEFRARFRGLLEDHLRNISAGEIPVAPDVAALAQEPVHEYEPVVPHAAVAHVPQVEPVVMPEAAAIPVQPIQPAAEEPPASGFVTSVHLGESAAPEMTAEAAPVFGEPVEFTFGGAGERDEDIDIEEID
jgi:cell division initiation protein